MSRKQSGATPVRVILADDHTIVRRGLAALLHQAGGYRVVAEAQDGEEMLRQAGAVEADVAIVDLSMPRLNGVEATRRLQRQHPHLKVLVLSMYDDEEFVVQVLQAGASGYILKRSMEDELFTAVDAAVAGELFVSPSIPPSVVRAALRGQAAHETGLTPREREILQLIAKGHTSAEIANLLHISPHTVSRHRANLMQKLDARNQLELVRLAVERGLVIMEQPPHPSTRNTDR